MVPGMGVSVLAKENKIPVFIQIHKMCKFCPYTIFTSITTRHVFQQGFLLWGVVKESTAMVDSSWFVFASFLLTAMNFLLSVDVYIFFCRRPELSSCALVGMPLNAMSAWALVG